MLLSRVSGVGIKFSGTITLESWVSPVVFSTPVYYYISVLIAKVRPFCDSAKES